MLEPYNLILETGQLKTLYFHHNIRHLKSITTTNIYTWFLVYDSHGVKVGRYTAQVPTFSLPRLSSNSELQAAATCSWATAYALQCAVRLCHTAQQGGEFSVFSLYGILYVQDVYCIIIPLSTEAPHIRGILQHSAVLYQHLKMQTH